MDKDPLDIVIFAESYEDLNDQVQWLMVKTGNVPRRAAMLGARCDRFKAVSYTTPWGEIPIEIITIPLTLV